MYHIDFSKPQHIHFIGIGGISMSGLAIILIKESFTVSGSDTKETKLTEYLISLGADIKYGQCAENISQETKLVVYTAAVHEDNPELMEARSRSLHILTRAELLGQIMSNYATPIGIAGTHGKTTTTSMLSQILVDADLDPTISVGGILKTIGGNIRVGHSEYFITEACEYTNSFLSLAPKIGVILNAEEDHLDFFENLAHILRSFHAYAALLPADGTLVICGDIEGLSVITADIDARIVTYGLDPSYTYSASNITYDEMGCASYDLYIENKYIDRIRLSVNGEHNVKNSLSAIAVCDALQLPLETAKTGLLAFEGTDRRFEYKGECNGFTIVDDYAHHPTEIEATLKAAKNYPHKELWCVFQPHTYTRTKAFFDKFAQALAMADHVILTDIYAARETDTLGVSSEALAAAIAALGIDAHYLSSFKEVELFVIEHCKKNDLLITMGAGDVVNIGTALLEK